MSKITQCMKDLLKAYPELAGRESITAKPKHKVVVRMLDRRINNKLNDKLLIRPDRLEELTVTFHTAGQDVLWTMPIICVLEDETIIADMDTKELDALRFVYHFDNWSE